MSDDEARRLRQMAAGWMIGWEEFTDPQRVAWGEAWTQAGRRLMAAVDEMHPESKPPGSAVSP